ncbi:hypothetical protein LCGC14_0761760 [marine sediment metagenome]|uniref:Uncharacterized protein n=1 Tax=marine sediment metagenome TaxID=412755 RepID=A0A0F9SKX5_9ZZZZ|nr:hypothetical protein [bacterium]
MSTVIDRTNELVNSWLQETIGLPITMSLGKLGFKVVDALESAIQDEREACAILAERHSFIHPPNVSDKTVDAVAKSIARDIRLRKMHDHP